MLYFQIQTTITIVMPQQSECRRAGPPQPAAGEEAGRRHSHVLNPNPNRNSNHSGDASTSQSIKDSLTQPDTGHGAPSRTPSRTPDMAHPAGHPAGHRTWRTQPDTGHRTRPAHVRAPWPTEPTEAQSCACARCGPRSPH